MKNGNWASVLVGITGGIGFSLAGWAVSFALAKTSYWSISLFAALLLPLIGLGVMTSVVQRKSRTLLSGVVSIAYAGASFIVEAVFYLIANIAA